MKLKYAEDVKWNDLAKIENPFFAKSTVSHELNRSLSRLTGGFGFEKNPLDQIYKQGRHEIDDHASRQFYKDIEAGNILLVHDFEVPAQRRAFQYVSDKDQPDKKRWQLTDSLSNMSAMNLENILLQVKQPHSPGPILARTPDLTAMGAAAVAARNTNQDTNESYLLRFKMLDKNGRAIANLPYKTVKTGTSAQPLHIADAKTPSNGLTTAVSTTKNEEIDLYIVWAKLTVNKSYLKM